MRISWIALAIALASGSCTTDDQVDTDDAEQAVTGTLTPSGPYTEWTLPRPLYNLDAHIAITTPPPATATEFWSTQFWLIDGNGGYMGLQNAGELPDGGSGKIAIASIWGATSATASNGSKCLQFNEGGLGYSCRLAYNWVPGHDYRLRAWQSGAGNWVFAVADMNTGVEIPFGVIHVPTSWGWIDNSDVINWTEYFAANNPSGLLVHCSDLPGVVAQFTLSGHDADGIPTPTLLSAHVANASCHNTTESLLSATTVRQSFGGPINSYLSQGQTLEPGQDVLSPDGHTVFINQTDGNVVVYHNGVALWASNTVGIAGPLEMQTDGNLVLYTPKNVWRWQSGTPGHVITTLEVQNDCNVVLYQNGRAIWSTETNGCVKR